MAKVTLGDMVAALTKIREWTQAVHIEVLDCPAPQQERLQGLGVSEAVANAAAAAAVAVTAADTAKYVLGDAYELASDKANARIEAGPIGRRC